MSDKQLLSIHEANKRFNIWCGAVRSGKTFASIEKFLKALKHGIPGDVMIIGVNRMTIQRNVLELMYKKLGFPAPASKSSEAKLYGRNVYFVGANDESAVRAIQGATLAYAYVDEATCIPEPFWKMLQSRASLKGSQIFATCNPEGPVHWLKKDFIDRAHELDLIYWSFVMDDNPSLTENFKNNLKKEYGYGVWYRRLILGEWAVSTGIVYDSFDDLNLYENPKHNPVYYIAALDYGTINPTCCVVASVNPSVWPQICIEEEYYYDPVKTGRSKSDAELADDIKRFLSYRPIRSLFVDPSAASLKVELRAKDIPVLDAINDVIQGIQITSKFINGKNVLIHKSCKNLREQLQSYQWDHKAAERGEDKPLKSNDHAVDALRYLCASGFRNGQFGGEGEGQTIDQIRKQIYGDDGYGFMNPDPGGYI
jgi:PBSX family phage terminase large subunit